GRRAVAPGRAPVALRARARVAQPAPAFRRLRAPRGRRARDPAPCGQVPADTQSRQPGSARTRAGCPARPGYARPYATDASLIQPTPCPATVAGNRGAIEHETRRTEDHPRPDRADLGRTERSRRAA